MTFEDWWKKNGIELATFAEKSAARKGWEAGALAEREACAKIAEVPVSGEQDDITMEAKDRVAAAIRARSNDKVSGATRGE